MPLTRNPYCIAILKSLSRLGFTTQDLSNATGFHRSTIARWLNDSRPDPQKRGSVVLDVPRGTYGRRQVSKKILEWLATRSEIEERILSILLTGPKKLITISQYLGLPFSTTRALMMRLEERGFVYRLRGGEWWAASSRWIIHTVISEAEATRPQVGSGVNAELLRLCSGNESGEKVAGETVKAMGTSVSSGKIGVAEGFGERQSALPTQYDPVRSRVNPRVMSPGVQSDPQDYLDDANCDRSSKAEIGGAEAQTPETNTEGKRRRCLTDCLMDIS